MIPSKRNSNLVLVESRVDVSGNWNPEAAWVEYRRVWVSIAPNRGREIFQGNELGAVVTHTIRGDFLELEGVSETMRIVYNDTHEYDGPLSESLVFDILAVMPNHDGRDDTMIQANLKGLRYGNLSPNIPQ